MVIATTSICKNEMKYLQLWYDSLKDEVDYITVLDTGSTDGTYELLLELSNKDPKLIVKQQVVKPWRFDKARQLALDLLPEDTDVFISLDIDERFEPGFAKVIRDHWDLNLHYQGSFLYIRNEEGHQFKCHKIYGTNYSWHWEYPVHETLVCEPFEPEHLIDLSDKITLKHYQPMEDARNYLPLLEMRKKEYPNDAMTYYYLAREYFYNELWGSLLNVTTYFVKKKLEAPPVNVAYMLMLQGMAYNETHKEKKFIDSIELAIQTCPEYRDPYMVLIKYMLSIGAKPIARDLMDKCITNTKRLYEPVEISRDSWGTNFEQIKFICYH